MKLKDVKMFNVTQYIVLFKKLKDADNSFKEFLSFYDPMKIIYINKSSLSITTEDGDIKFAKEDNSVIMGRHTCIFLSPIDYNEFVMKYIDEKRDQDLSMTKLQKIIYNIKLKHKYKKNRSLKYFINLNASLKK